MGYVYGTVLQYTFVLEYNTDVCSDIIYSTVSFGLYIPFLPAAACIYVDTGYLLFCMH